MSPLFSVLMPTHDRADVVGTAIESVLDQSVGDFELLVVGDGCRDATAEVVAAFGDPRIRWFDLPKAAGFGYANRNVALRAARGQIVAYAAHDDVYLPNHLELVAEAFEDPRVMWAHSRPLWVRDDGLMVPFFVNLTIDAHVTAFLSSGNSLPSVNVAHRRECLAADEWPEDAEAGGDYVLWKRMIRRILDSDGASSVAFCRAVTALHFKASWKRDDAIIGPRPLQAIFDAIDAHPDAWPGSLNGLPPGEPGGGPVPSLQSRYLGAIRSDASYCARINDAVLEAQDRFSWSRTPDAMPFPRVA